MPLSPARHMGPRGAGADNEAEFPRLCSIKDSAVPQLQREQFLLYMFVQATKYFYCPSNSCSFPSLSNYGSRDS